MRLTTSAGTASERQVTVRPTRAERLRETVTVTYNRLPKVTSEMFGKVG